MRILSMTATFGKLERETLSLAPGLNVIPAPNEWGKSTWCAFLISMLYGLDPARNSKSNVAEKDRYAPWSGSPMSGRMELEWQGRILVIERKAKGHTAFADFRAYERDSGLAVPELTAANCGEQLLGVERSVFLRAGFLRLKDLPVTDDHALRRRLNALVTTGDESGTGDLLAQKLKALKNSCQVNRASGLLPQARAQKAECSQGLQKLADLRAQEGQIKARQAALAQTIAALENHRDALQYAKAQQDAAQVTKAQADQAQAAQRLAQQEQLCQGLPTEAQATTALARLEAFQRERQRIAQAAQALRPPEALSAPEHLPDRGQTQADLVSLETHLHELEQLQQEAQALTEPEAPVIPAELPARSEIQIALSNLFQLRSSQKALMLEAEQLRQPEAGPELAAFPDRSPAQAAADQAEVRALTTAKKTPLPAILLGIGAAGVLAGVALLLLRIGLWPVVLGVGGISLLAGLWSLRSTRSAQAANAQRRAAIEALYGSLPPERWEPMAREKEAYRQTLAVYQAEQERLRRSYAAWERQMDALTGGKTPEDAEAEWKRLLSAWDTVEVARQTYRQELAVYQTKRTRLTQREEELNRQIQALARGQAPQQAVARCREVLARWKSLDSAQAAHLEALAAYQAERAKYQSQLEALERQIAPDTHGKPPEEAIKACRQVLSAWEALAQARDAYTQAEAHTQALRAMVKPAQPPRLPDSRTESAEETALLLATATKEQKQLQLNLGQCLGQMDTLGQESQLRQRLDAINARIAALEDTFAALTLALETLEQATAELQRRFAPRIAQRAQALFGRLTGGRYDRLTMDQDLSLRTGARDETTLHSAVWRSDGTADQLYLALRLAVAEELTPGAPLILDDALVRFDDTRLALALEILREEAAAKQVILFTCQQREQAYLDS